MDALAGFGTHFLPQHPGFRVIPPDLRHHHGTLRRRRRLFSALMDFIFMVKGSSYAYITGPRVVKGRLETGCDG